MSAERIEADVAELCSFEERLPGTDAERRASKFAAARLAELGLPARTDATYAQPQWALVHFLHCAMAAIGSMIAGLTPPIGFALVLVAATSAYFDLSARHYLLRRLPFRRASQNVHTLRPSATPMPTVVLCANLDAPRTGAAYNRFPAKLQEAAARRAAVIASPTRIWFWSMALLVPPLGARLAGFEPTWLAALQLPQTLVLIVACFLLGEIALSGASPAANTNASGVAGVLEALRRLGSDPPGNLRVEAVLLGGGETTMEGMRAFLGAHHGELDRERTWFISLESIGRGTPRFLVSQGPAVSLPMSAELVEMCALLGGDGDGSAADDRRAAPLRDGRTSAALVARTHKYRGLAITCREEDRALPANHHTLDDTPAEVDSTSIAAASALAVDVIRLLDRDRGRSAARRPPASAPEEPALRPA